MGFFSTVGDIECLNITGRWLKDLGIPYDVAPYAEDVRRAIPGALDPRNVDPHFYSHLIVICGPCWKDWFRIRKIDLSRFSHCVRIGLNLTMIDPVENWNPFDVLIERDSNRVRRPDMTFIESTQNVPVVGRCLAPRPRDKHYESRERCEEANRAINELIERKNLAVIDIDTRWPSSRNTAGQKNANQVVSLMKRVDVMLTTRLHGMVFSIKSGVPVIAVDFISGGEKLSAQSRAIDWPMTVLAEKATPEWMDQAFEWCLSSQAYERIQYCKVAIKDSLQSIENEFYSSFTTDTKPSPLLPEIEPGFPERFMGRLFRKR